VRGVTVSKRDGERGASAVEFAIIASLLLLILFGTVTFGIVFNRYQGLQSAAREGARLGALSQTTRTIILDRVRESVSIINGSSINATCPGTLSVEQGCIRVFRRPAPGSSPVELTDPDAKPCNQSHPGSDKSVIVEVYYRLRIDIPLWASPAMTISGGAEFKCEG
jgi:Flp pilus assembly pilin Flp